MRLPWLLLGLPLLAGCQVLLAQQDRYTGRITDCDGAEAHATLVVVDQHFSFTPTDGSLVISGDVAPDGTFSGTEPLPHTGNSTAPVLAVAGKISPDAADGLYTNPRCKKNFQLPYIEHSVLP